MEAAVNTEKFYQLGGSYRCCLPHETLQKIKPLFPKLGITRIAQVTGLDELGIPVATCIRPNSKHLSVSQGKGITQELANISAIMESVEGYHAENPPAGELVGCYKKLCHNSAFINPALFSNLRFVPSYFDTHEIAWVKGLNMNTEESVFLPHVLVCLDSTVLRPEYNFLSVSTNGLASGNSYEEALCHAFFEIIERDALCRWQRLPDNQKMERQLDLDTITSDIHHDLLHRFAKSNIQVRVWNITSTCLPIPSFHCSIRGRLGIFTGTGTHFSKEIALTRALTEAAQARLTLISGNRDDVFPDYYFKRASELNLFQNHIVQNGHYSYQDIFEPEFSYDFKENVRQIVQLLVSQGFRNVLVVDHTKREFGIAVVQVFVPNCGSKIR